MKSTPKSIYSTQYTPFGVIIATPMVAEVLENKHGIDNPVIDLRTGDSTTSTSGSTGVVVPTSGVVNDSNVTFAFDAKPALVIVNGDTYREGHGWSWDGANVILDAAPGVDGDVYGIGGGTTLVLQIPSGTVDNSNTTFVFASAPTLVVVNGKTYRSGHGWSGTTTVTLDYAPGVGGDVYSIL